MTIIANALKTLIFYYLIWEFETVLIIFILSKISDI